MLLSVVNSYGEVEKKAVHKGVKGGNFPYVYKAVLEREKTELNMQRDERPQG